MLRRNQMSSEYLQIQNSYYLINVASLLSNKQIYYIHKHFFFNDENTPNLHIF